MKDLLNAQEVSRAVAHLSKLVASKLPRKGPIAVIGIRTRGEVLAQRLVKSLRRSGRSVEYGILDITFYRDDLSLRKGMPLVRATEIDFDLDGKIVLLVDDVLATGRSVRAAMDALVDFGRPKAIRLAVLVDRGGRELPIAADFVGTTVKAPLGKRVQVHLKEHDGEERVYLVGSNRRKKR